MRIALVAPTYLGQCGGVERRVDRLARGLAARGAEVEILAQGPKWEQHSVIRPLASLHRFPSAVGRLRFSFAHGLYEGLRAAADRVDLVDVHSGYGPLVFAVARARFRRRVLTPYGAAHRLTSGPYAYLARPIIDSYAQIICSSVSECELLRRRFPWAAERTRAMPLAMDMAAVEAATPFTAQQNIVLSAGRLERSNRIDRAIAAMAALDASMRLLIIGEGPARDRLRAYADDLRLSSRVKFVGSVPHPEQYRWLRTARVVVALAEHHTSGLEVLEALAAGTPVVASDIAVHREVANQFASPPVTFVAPTGSPLDLADAILDASERPTHPYTAESMVRSWESVVDETWELYCGLVYGPGSAGRNGQASRELPADLDLTTKQVLGG
jgi:glycosyltransferase involved in cell wall biosynthesis